MFKVGDIAISKTIGFCRRIGTRVTIDRLNMQGYDISIRGKSGELIHRSYVLTTDLRPLTKLEKALK